MVTEPENDSLMETNTEQPAEPTGDMLPVATTPDVASLEAETTVAPTTVAASIEIPTEDTSSTISPAIQPSTSIPASVGQTEAEQNEDANSLSEADEDLIRRVLERAANEQGSGEEQPATQIATQAADISAGSAQPVPAALPLAAAAPSAAVTTASVPSSQPSQPAHASTTPLAPSPAPAPAPDVQAAPVPTTSQVATTATAPAPTSPPVAAATATAPPPTAQPVAAAAPAAPGAPAAPSQTASMPAVVAQPLTMPPAQSFPRKRKNRWPRRIIMFFVWIVVIIAMVFLALMIAAYITGFRNANGVPDVRAMLDWIIANYNLTR